MKTTPAADSEPDNTSTQVLVSLRGDQAVQPQSPATRRPVPAALPVDDTTDIAPHERQMLEAMNSLSSEQFQYIRQMAKKFEDAVNGGDVATQREICFSVGTVCSKCGKPCLSANRDKWAPKRCSGCLNWRSNDVQQSIYYCSKECQTADWKPISGRSTKQPGVYHKDWCKVIRDEYMPQLPYFQAQLSQFPWGRLERDGTFSNKFLQARFDVLDSDYRKAGFWAVPERLNPHDISNDPLSNSAAQPFMRPNTNLKGYAHGAMMLALEEWPSDVEGWKLQDDAFIPHIFFTAQFPPPGRPRPGQVRDWKSWYDWRRLSLESPACFDDLLPPHGDAQGGGFAASVERETGNRRSLSRSGDRANYLPLFSELALLLPNIHINLVIFSPATLGLLEHARQRYPRSIAAREGPVWEYTAPQPTGGGSIAISLYHAPPLPPIARQLQLRPFKGVWEHSVMMLAPKDPDALVALNAGILSCGAWPEVIACATMANVPFACTDYAQQSVQMCTDQIPEWLNDASRNLPPGENMHQELVRQRTRPVTVNPFHHPGQRPISQVRSPNLGNGFICRIVGPE
ncbi:hypothetical protein DFH08DRAFT_883117 [Mycena albidolilacea]|uniref:MYND-type domain-containing protein n=1 Tax=Mycena albidolilacea TaxID=1033008 RepID=A0AAD6ZLR3_9AGAR|nr:hypothetical protein DFH08DRAFT_883117 [Mycena albidolilacea]